LFFATVAPPILWGKKIIIGRRVKKNCKKQNEAVLYLERERGGSGCWGHDRTDDTAGNKPKIFEGK